MSELQIGVLSSLIASIAGAVIALFASRTIRFWTKTRPIKRVWGRLIDSNSKKLIVGITSLRTSPEEGNRAVTTVAESTALASLLSSLKQECKTMDVEIYPSDRFPTMRLGESLLLTGGPRNNSIAKLLCERCDLPFRFDGHDLIIGRNGDKHYSAVIVSNSVVKDYAIIAAMHNPFDDDHFIYLVAGCYAYGVNAALRAMNYPFVGNLSKRIISDEFAIIIEADVVDEYVSIPHIVSVHTLTDHKSVTGTESIRRLEFS